MTGMEAMEVCSQVSRHPGTLIILAALSSYHYPPMAIETEEQGNLDSIPSRQSVRDPSSVSDVADATCFCLERTDVFDCTRLLLLLSASASFATVESFMARGGK